MRTIIIGDIHGCSVEFEALLSKVELNRKRDVLVLIGDVIDRGPEPCLVLHRILELNRDMGERFVFLRGNHEDLAIGAYTGDGRSLWDLNGGAKTRKSFYAAGERFQTYIPYLRSLKFFYETEDFLCAHAAVSKEGPEKTDKRTFLWDRYVAYDGTYQGKLLIYGHTPMEEVLYQDGFGNETVCLPDETRPLPKTGSICIDTGCVRKNRLSALVIENGRYTVRAVQYGKTR